VVRKPDKMEKQQRDKNLKRGLPFYPFVSYICSNVIISFGLFSYEEILPCDKIKYENGEEEFLSTYICVNLRKTQKDINLPSSLLSSS
jgi:hypothetical protein